MLEYRYPNNTPISLDRPFEIDGIKFPANWLRLATEEDLQRFGISLVEVPDPEPEVPSSPSVPASVTPRQLRLALLEIGMLTAVEGFVAQADEATKIEWDYAAEVRRDHPMWTVGAQALNKTSEDIDNLFILAVSK